MPSPELKPGISPESKKEPDNDDPMQEIERLEGIEREFADFELASRRRLKVQVDEYEARKFERKVGLIDMEKEKIKAIADFATRKLPASQFRESQTRFGKSMGFERRRELEDLVTRKMRYDYEIAEKKKNA